MGFAQLYYTSCEQGLSGYSGYQFNAATPGVDPQVLREVERFTVYEPPRSSSPDRVEEHPVNLCYAPDLGGAAVLSRVVSSGADPSGRPGNYFVHSLVVGPGPDGAASSGPLPAELWGAGFWTAAPVNDTDLPPLSVPGGPLDRARSQGWVLRRPPAVVARLLAAADSAVDGGLPVVLVADSETVAHWVAALTHLLPPGRARELSFATYSGSPDDTLVHVVGVPARSETYPLRDRFTVFDPASATADSLPEPDPDTARVAGLLAAAGPGGAMRLWERAAAYSSGTETSLARWRPVVSAAAVLDGLEGPAEADDGRGETGGPAEEDLRAVREWLPEAVAWLAPGVTTALVTQVLDAGPGDLDDAALASLQKVAHDAGSERVIERLESVMVRRSLDGVAAGSPAPPVAPMRSEPVREAARGHIAALLEKDRGGIAPERVVELLRWARAGGLAPPASSMERYGLDVLAWHLNGSAPDTAPTPAVETLLRAHDEIRRGTARRLATWPPDRLATLAAGPVGALFAPDRDPSSALLRELRCLGSDRRSEPARLLADVVDIRREGRAGGAPGLADHDLDGELLTGVFGPDHGPAEVLVLLRAVRSKVRADHGVGDWVTEALVTAPDDDGVRAWRELVAELSGHWLGALLPHAGTGVLDDWTRAGDALAALRGEREDRIPVRLAAVYGAVEQAHPAVRSVALGSVADTLSGWRQPQHLAVALRDCPPEVFDLFCRSCTRLLESRRDESDRAALLFGAAMRGPLRDQAPQRTRTLLDEVLAPTVGTWRKRRTDAVGDRVDQALSEDFREWSLRLREERGTESGGFLGWLKSWGGRRRA